MVRPSVVLSKNDTFLSRTTVYKEHFLKKQYFEVSLGCYVLRYCVIGAVQLINTSCGTVYNLYRASVYVSYSFSYLNLFFTDRELVWCGRTTRVRRVLFPRYLDLNRVRSVAYNRLISLLFKNKPSGMCYYFLTLGKGEDVKDYLSRYFYKNSSYRYVSFREVNSKKGGFRVHNHFILILPECLKDHLSVGDNKFSFVEEKNLCRVISYCIKSGSVKGIKVSKNMCIPKLIRLNKNKLTTILSVIFSSSPSAFSWMGYKGRSGDSCVRVSLKIDGGLDVPDYNLKIKKKIML